MFGLVRVVRVVGVGGGGGVVTACVLLHSTHHYQDLVLAMLLRSSDSNGQCHVIVQL